MKKNRFRDTNQLDDQKKVLTETALHGCLLFATILAVMYALPWFLGL